MRARNLAVVASLVAAAGLAVGCSSSGSGSRPGVSAAQGCSGQHAAGGAAGAGASPGAGARGLLNPAIAAAWTLPGGNLQNTRDVASSITRSDVSSLGVAWCVPIESTGKAAAGGVTDGYETTPVIVNGVVYVQDVESNVMAIRLATGKVLWTHDYSSINGGPDGVNVVGGTVYAATDEAAVALSAATGRQLWSRKLTGNDHEGIDMAPGYNHGTVYVSTVPVDPNVGQYLGGGKGVLWALNARTGAPEWSWDEVGNLWGRPGINSGGGLWDPPSFDSAGNLYIGIGNPGPIGQTGWPAGYPWGTSRPGPDLYTDAVVKLSPAGKLLWYYQLTPHDLYDWDVQNSPVLTMAGGQPVVVDGGKAGILFELSAQTGRLLWKLPVGVHSGHDNDGLRTEHATPAAASSMLPGTFTLEPGLFGGIETQLATNGSATFAAVNNLAVPMSISGVTGTDAKALEAAVARATGEMIAVSQETGKVEWDDKLPSSPYGAAAVTGNVVFTTTYSGFLYAFNAATGAILLKTPMSAGSNAPVAIAGDYVIAGAGLQSRSPRVHNLIIAYRLGGTGKLPDTVG
ncbi:MAG TPA: PQQ-binding-like beta-propeller repeat protein [Streptosporangiaceae bacterium]|nr:PQQ-binding-like beta-propeller repeat protein [Streptosporangiaceae bacterium]